MLFIILLLLLICQCARRLCPHGVPDGKCLETDGVPLIWQSERGMAGRNYDLLPEISSGTYFHGRGIPIFILEVFLVHLPLDNHEGCIELL